MFASAAAIVGLSPVFLLTMAAVKLEDGSPVFYFQKRVGRDEKVFSMLKFRSMRVDAEKIHDELRRQYGCDEVSFKLKDDPRVTRVGRLIRKMNIDELPQLFNILKGDMSIVGPRPFLSMSLSLSVGSMVLNSVSGILCPKVLPAFGRYPTGGGIFHLIRGMNMDVRYAESHSFLRDLYLIGVTAAQILTGRAGY